MLNKVVIGRLTRDPELHILLVELQDQVYIGSRSKLHQSAGEGRLTLSHCSVEVRLKPVLSI